MPRRMPVIIAGAAVLVLAVCLAIGDFGPGERDAPAAHSQATVRLRFTYWGSIEEKRAIEQAMAKFMERYPWISVEAVQIPNPDYNTKLLAMSSANEEPDLGYMTTELGELLAQQGKFLDLFAFIDRDENLSREEFLDFVWHQIEPEEAWGVSIAVECYGLFYRKDLFEEAGIDPPPSRAEEAWTWEEFVDAAKRLTLDDKGRNAHHPDFDKDRIVRYGVMFETWSEPISNFVFSNGGRWIDGNGEQFLLHEPEAAQAIQMLADLINVHHVAPSPFESKSMPALNVALQAGLTAMIIDGQWINLDLGKAGVNYDIGVLPKLKDSVTVALSGANVIFASTRHPEEAWLLLKWLLDPNEAIDLYADGLWMPTLKAWYTDPALIDRWVGANPAAHPPGFADAMMNQLLKNGVKGIGYYLKHQAEIFPIVKRELIPVWLGQKRAREALDEIRELVAPYFPQ